MDDVAFEIAKEGLTETLRWHDPAKGLRQELQDLHKVRHPAIHRAKASRC